MTSAGAMLYQMSYKATQLRAGQFVGLMSSHERTRSNKCICLHEVRVIGERCKSSMYNVSIKKTQWRTLKKTED